MANRVQRIKKNSNIEQRKFMSSKDYPVDDGSRGFDALKIA